MLIVIVRFAIKTQHVDDFIAPMLHQARISLEEEPGCLQFDVCRSDEDPTQWLLYEAYADDQAFADHLARPSFKEFDTVTRPWIASKTVERWRK
jgi:quinol monooxygenase YgiN